MISIRNLSIPKKIVGIIVIISSAALLLASLALVAYDAYVARRDLMANATTLAEIIADNTSAAVQFQDQQAAGETVGSIRVDPSIVAACVYSNFKLFAQYIHSGEASCPPQPAAGAQSLNYIVASAPIRDKDKTLGIVQLRATLEPTYAHLRLELATVAV